MWEFVVILVLASMPFHSMLKLKKSDREEVPLGCKLAIPQYDQQRQCSLSPVVSDHRLVAIGDIHGSYAGLLEDLFYANITSARHECTWKAQSTKTVLVQMGDLVDRGPGALESFKCLRKLQKEAHLFNSEVVRLFGNHELWWLTGIFYEKHPTADTKANIIAFITGLIEDIVSGAVRGAYLHTINTTPIIFVHAGFSPAYLQYLRKQDIQTPPQLVNHTHNQLVQAIKRCDGFPCRTIKGEVFDAGPDRGGSGVGGPFWTDFGVLERAVQSKQGPRDFLQIVGHTMAFCYSKRQPDVHPPDYQAECSLGLVRSTDDLSGVCVDGGMFLGARAFLEITPAGHMVAYERRGKEGEVPWKIRDLTAETCKAYKPAHASVCPN
eukprot:gene25996-31391_t